MRRAVVSTFVLLCAAGAVGGCSRRHPPPPPASASPVPTPSGVATRPTGGGTFDRPKLGIRLDWPAGWFGRNDTEDYVLVVGKQSVGEEGPCWPAISLDVPDLPLHLPGMIPIGSVRGGYLDDLRKSVGPIKTRDESPPPIPSSAARMVRSTWTDSNGQAWQETALLLVHADRVYILRARSLTTDEDGTRAAFDEIVRSLKWTR
jgi:hypothetical protein